MKAAFIVDAIRTPIGNFTGSLAPVRADDLAAHVIRALLERHVDLDPKAVDDVILGCANQAGEDNRNLARMALLLAGLPVTVPGETVNRLCASGMSAVVQAGRAIAANNGDLFIAGGMEHMTRGPWVMSKTSTPYGRDAQLFDSSFGWRFVNPLMQEQYGVDAMGETAENLLDATPISREDQDRFALWSQQKAAAAQANGRLAIEIAPVSIPQRKADPIIFAADEFVKPGTTMEGLARLRPAFKKDGTVTAGNASGLNDGAAAALIASEVGMTTHGLEPLARIVSSAVVGVEPRIMGIGPVTATKLALERAGLSLDDIDILELNEAFAAQALSCTRSLGLEDNDPRINPNGGAIALGHPLGMSGTRLLQTAALELQAKKQRYALCTLCIGVGQGYATVIEAC
ncbi:MAG TPA: 3-oxoadipyl-CoA thiolase [Flavobacteriales bacterium]|jgi:acetyl-CoA acyltransferase|nr:3-oxoadipyl-CoA thiolase [Flavobacteriales bacterium]MBK8532457.1 3-oxoadipyl-CoA thiolase [Flavobacteriales bacterium]MBK8708879.1 3-oxoadipyl-CoA thiolase [Flavobacteriales bacterium]HQW05058.1 3-oxoadipyl-CoA thiolase [Flavobacteriales bacterium]HQW97883.1 3-oxoadipyl-CoA thiolase [Flavobacteriales bacterium]